MYGKVSLIISIRAHALMMEDEGKISKKGLKC